jgi:hypothetical protein
LRERNQREAEHVRQWRSSRSSHVTARD